MTEALRRWSARAIPPWMRAFLYLEFAALCISIVASEVAHTMMLLGFLAWRPWHPMQRRLPRWVWAPFAALLGVAVLSALAGPAPLRGLGLIGHDYRFYGVPFLVLFALPWADERRLLRVLLAGTIVAAAAAVLEYYTGPLPKAIGGVERLDLIDGRYRAQGLFSHPLTFSGAMLVVAPLLASVARAEKGRWRWAFALGSAAAVVGVAVSLTRSALVGLAVGVVALAAQGGRRVVVPLVIAGVLAAVGLGLLVGTPAGRSLFEDGRLPATLARLSPTALRHGSEDRFFLWEAAWLGALDHLWLGVGSNNPDGDILPYQRAVSAAHGGYDYRQSWGASAHNVYLTMLFELGVPGLAAYLWMWGTVFAWGIGALRRAPPDALWERTLLWGAMAGMAGSMAAGFFEDNALDGEVQALLTVLFGLVLHVGLRVRQARRDLGG